MTDHFINGRAMHGHELSGYALAAETISHSHNYGREAAAREMAATIANFKEGCTVGEELEILQGYIFGLLVAAQTFVDRGELL